MDSKINKSNLFILTLIHALGFWGVSFISEAHLFTIWLAVILYFLTGLSITGGLHRLWSHRSYAASLPLQLFYLFFSTMAMVGSAIWWCRDHRIHHKYSDTELDPHNANKGFWWSHIGWLFFEKKSTIKEVGKKIPMDDLLNDPLLRFQHRYYLLLSPTLALGLPMGLGLLWGDPIGGLMVAGFVRILAKLHATLAINSFAHAWGSRPYKSDILPVENHLLSLFAHGEGYHNYHHTYQYDWKASENLRSINLTGWMIWISSKIGLASGLKQAKLRDLSKVAKKVYL
jgi:stearoyl-CoA desaturase (delta-9 desaturase)